MSFAMAMCCCSSSTCSRHFGETAKFVRPASVTAHRLTGQSIYNIVRTLGEKVGVTARPHQIRHSAITDALDLSGDIRAVARFSRHKDIKVLMIYDDNRADLGGEVAKRIAGAIG